MRITKRSDSWCDYRKTHQVIRKDHLDQPFYEMLLSTDLRDKQDLKQDFISKQKNINGRF